MKSANILKLAIFTCLLGSSAFATSDRGVYCMLNQSNLASTVATINAKLDQRHDFTVAMNSQIAGQSSKVLDRAKLLGIAIDSQTIARWQLKYEVVSVFGEWSNIKIPYLKPTYVTRYNVCAALED